MDFFGDVYFTLGSIMLPSNEQIRTILSSKDNFRLAIIGFSSIEQALNLLILEALSTTHKLELQKLSIELKLDLAIALRVLRKESKGLVKNLSKIRNYYAHSYKQEANFNTVSELKSYFSQAQRKMASTHFKNAITYTDTLCLAISIAYYEIEGSIKILKNQKIKKSKKKRCF